MKKLFPFILLALLPVVASAYTPVDNITISGYDVKIDGIYYKFMSEDEAWVSYELYRYVSYYNQNGEFSESTEYLSDYSGDIVIPESFTYNDKTYRVTGINDYTFYDHKSITSVTIPNSVTRIGKEVFRGCTGLTDLYCLSEIAPEATNAFDYASVSNITLHVPKGSEESYKSTSPWCYFFGVIPTGSIEINAANFPDSYFRNWVHQLSIGTDGVLTAEEMASVKTIELLNGEDYPLCSCGPIKSLKGIEYFTELTKLIFDGINLDELDLTQNPKLNDLDGYGYTLKKINVSGCSELKKLDCSGNPLTELNVSGCISLTNLSCSNTRLTELNVSGCTSLTTLYCNNSQLIKLSASGCSSLTTLVCEANNLNVINVSGCTALTQLKYWKNKIKGAGMDALVESLPITSTGSLYVLWDDNRIHDQNVMTHTHVAAAKAKGWKVLCYDYGNTVDYAGSEIIEPVTYTKDQVATIILPTVPDASKGMYFRLDRWEEGKIAFEQELQPQAHVPYIIIPNEDFCIDLNTLDLAGLRQDTATIEGVNFIGGYVNRDLGLRQGHLDFLLDTTPDCYNEPDSYSIHVGPLRAYFSVLFRYCSSWVDLKLKYVLYSADGIIVTTEDPVTYTEGQMATIILPTVPDAGKGKYYGLDRVEDGKIIFKQELQPQAHIPYIIVPNEDFCIDPGTLDLAGLSPDTVSIGGIDFIGSYSREELNEPEDFYIDIIDTTPDCGFAPFGETGKGAFVGALRAYLQVRWDDPYNPGGSKGPGEKMEIVLKDNGTGIASPLWETGAGAAIYDLSGHRQSAPQKGMNIIRYADGNCKKVLIK